MLKKYRGYILPRIAKYYDLPSKVVHDEIKRFLNVTTLKGMEFGELSYFVRFADNILLINNIDIDEL